MVSLHPDTTVNNTPTATEYNASLDSPLSILSDAAGPQHSRWVACRWRMAAMFFARPVPYFTTKWELRMGDFCITIPFTLLCLVLSSMEASNKEVGFTGRVADITMMLVFGFVVHNNSLMLKITGIPFERALLYHKFFALLTIILTVLHIVAYMLDKEKMDEEHMPLVVSGWCLFAFFVLLYVSSLSYVRRHYFELFLRVHWVLFILVAIVGFGHGAVLSWIGFVPWLVDMSYRKYYRAPVYKNGKLCGSKDKGVIASTQVSIHTMPGNIIRIQFPRVRTDTGQSFEYEVGAYAFICVPSLSKWQSHPFTISSAPHEPFVTFHIKVLGDWTEKLFALAAQTSPLDPFDILVDGPYGSPSIDIESFQEYSHVVLFGGGIGVTPMQAIVNQLYHQYYHEKRCHLEQVKFIWSVRDRDVLKAIMDEAFMDTKNNFKQDGSPAAYLPDTLLHAGQDLNNIFQSEIYLTKGDADLEDPVDQRLSHCMHYSMRPDIASILRSTGEQAIQVGAIRVAVMVCGPEALVNDVLNHSMQLSKSLKIQFDVHTETFDF